MRDDQAQGLRKLFVRGAVPACAIGGAGVESAVLAIAQAFAARGDRVLLLDRSRGGIAACAGKRARHELWHVLEGDVAIGDVMIPLDDHLTLLPAARGLDLLAAGQRDWREALSAALGETVADPAGNDGARADTHFDARLDARFDTRFDLWLVHGLPPSHRGCDAPLFTITPTRASVTQTYAQIKALATAQGRRSFGVVVAGVRSDAEARVLFDGLAATARRFLGVELEYCGALPTDARGSVASAAAIAGLRQRIAASFLARDPLTNIAA